jgi:predicted transposase YbfD/YdcC
LRIKRKTDVDKEFAEKLKNIRIWILSRNMTAKEFGKISRGHWAIENKLHGVTDYSFREDWSIACKDNTIENLAQMRKICYTFMKLDPAVSGMTKKGVQLLPKNTDVIIRLIFTEIPKSEHPES